MIGSDESGALAGSAAPACEAAPVGYPLPAASHPLRTRLIAFGAFLGCGLVLGIAIWLKPDPSGFGTHRQLGFRGHNLAPCGTLITTGFPCPTCGMTTAFAHTVRGQVFRAAYAQPGGFVLALATILTFFGSFWTILAGRPPRIRGLSVSPYRLFTILLVVLLGGWMLKIAIGLADGSLPFKWS